MAVLFSLDNQAVPVGAILTNRAVTVPAGVAAVAYTVTVGTPPGDPANPPPQDLTAWVEWQDGKTWRELSRFTANSVSSSTGVIPLQGRKLRVSATCGIATTVTLIAESVNADGTAR